MAAVAVSMVAMAVMMVAVVAPVVMMVPVHAVVMPPTAEVHARVPAPAQREPRAKHERGGKSGASGPARSIETDHEQPPGRPPYLALPHRPPQGHTARGGPS